MRVELVDILEMINRVSLVSQEAEGSIGVVGGPRI